MRTDLTPFPSRLVLVEDEPAHAEAIRRAIANSPHAVSLQVVGTLREYRDVVARQPPDLAMVDLLLPDGRAIDVLTSPPEAGAFPVLVITSHGDERVAVEAMKAGALDYVVKSPEAFASMLRIVERAWREWGLLRSRAEAENSLRTLFDAIPESLFMLDADGRVVAGNETFAARLGTTMDEALGRIAYDLLPVEVAARRRVWLAEALRTGQRAVYEDIRNGRWMQQHLCPVPGADGKPSKVVVFAVDTTERRAAEDQLRIERTRLQVAMRAAKAGAFEWDIRQDRTYWTPELYGLYGLSPEGRIDIGSWRPALHPDDIGHAEQAIHAALASGHYDEEFRVVWPDGSVHWIEARGLVEYDPVDQRPVRMVGINVDVTERHRMEDELREVTDRYKNLVETSFDWVWEVDADGRYTYASGRVRDLLGYEPEEIVGRTPFDLMDPDEATRVLAIWRDISARRAAFAALENTCRHKNGRAVVFETSGIPVVGPKGEFLGYRGMDRDITERRQLEAQFRQAQKLEAIGQLAGGIAHDFNNILAATMMHLELLQASPSLDAETRAALRDIAAENQRAVALTRQLLMFSRRSVLDTKTLDLNAVVGNVHRMLSRLVGEQVDLQFEGGVDLPPVEADAGMLEQVLMNLVLNARDAMPKGGRILLSTMQREFDGTSIAEHGSRRLGRFVCLSVADSGSGMAPETVTRIFEPFFTTKEAGKGTGLGLATVHGIVAQHKGWIEVESTEGKGSVFRVLLPAVGSAATVAAERVKDLRLRRGKETVLLVEDDRSLRVMVTRALTSLGYRVLEAANGQDAMRLWERHGAEIDVLFTDMVMPEGITGLELHDTLRAIKPTLVTIVSSGYSADLVNHGAPTESGVVYLPKPYNLSSLAALIRERLDRAARH